MTQINVTEQLAPIAQVCRQVPEEVLIEGYVHAVRRLCRKSRWFEYTLAGATRAPITTPYTTGTVTVTSGNYMVVGVGSSWLTELVAGDLFVGPDAVNYTVAAVSTDLLLQLTQPYGGSTLAGQTYSVTRNRAVDLYSVGSDANNEVIGIRAVAIMRDASDIRGLTKKSSSDWDPNRAPNLPEEFQYVDEGQLALYPKPDAVYRLSMALILQPKAGVTTIDSTLVTKWDEAFRCGTLSYLQDMTGSPWANPGKAAVNETKFLDWMNRATSAAEARYSIPTTPW